MARTPRPHGRGVLFCPRRWLPRRNRRSDNIFGLLTPARQTEADCLDNCRQNDPIGANRQRSASNRKSRHRQRRPPVARPEGPLPGPACSGIRACQPPPAQALVSASGPACVPVRRPRHSRFGALPSGTDPASPPPDASTAAFAGNSLPHDFKLKRIRPHDGSIDRRHANRGRSA